MSPSLESLVKIRRLTETDLARIAPLSEKEQRSQLRQIRDKYPTISYNPTRTCYHDIFNVQYEMFGPAKRTSWDTIKARITKDGKSPQEIKSNLQVARGLYHYSESSGIVGRPEDFFPLPTSTGGKVKYWLPMVLNVEGVPLVPFVDPRRTYRLTEVGRRFAFSMMNERIRVADPSFAEAKFGIFQFRVEEGDQRSPILYTDEGMQLFSFDELEAMIATTYDLWRQILEEREAEARRKASGMRGDLL